MSFLMLQVSESKQQEAEMMGNVVFPVKEPSFLMKICAVMFHSLIPVMFSYIHRLPALPSDVLSDVDEGSQSSRFLEDVSPFIQKTKMFGCFPGSYEDQMKQTQLLTSMLAMHMYGTLLQTTDMLNL